MKVLVTGGCGYIGSHTVVELQNCGHEVLIIDNLSNSNAGVVKRIEMITGKKTPLDVFDICNKDETRDFFKRNKNIDGIIHFAAFKAVEESVKLPLLYYRNNLISLMNILEEMGNNHIPHIVFSSSCTVYGQPEKLPVTEDTPVQAAYSPYGKTKQISEGIITDFIVSGKSISAILLRYFNPIGAHSSSLIGELPIGIPNNLMPYITQTAAGKREYLKVFGNDYNTPDGTAIRDYIHVVDLAQAHIKALNRLADRKNRQPYEVFNVGAGKGYSVLEVINSFVHTTGVKLNYRFFPRRPGDVEKIWAATKKANNLLEWYSERNLDDMTLSAWNWEKNINKNKDLL